MLGPPTREPFTCMRANERLPQVAQLNPYADRSACVLLAGPDGGQVGVVTSSQATSSTLTNQFNA